MRGGQVFMEALAAHGVDRIFGNPGTTENSVLDRLIDYPDLEYIVALHEGIAVGAASFYAQATGRTGIVNLHVAPGLGNGIGMIYGALKANAPIIVTAGAQDTRLRLRAPILGHDLVAMAAPVTKWSAEPRNADELAPLLYKAFQVAHEPPCGPVFLALPNNVLEQETAIAPRGPIAPFVAETPNAEGVARAGELLRTASSPVIVVGDVVAQDDALDELIRFAEGIGAPVYQEPLRGQLAFPNRHPNFRGRVPFEAAALRSLFAPHDLIVLLGGTFFEEIWFDEGSPIPAGARVLQVDIARQRIANNFPVDVALVGTPGRVLPALTVAVGEAVERQQAVAAAGVERRAGMDERLARQRGSTPMAPAVAVAEIAAGLPDNVVVADESITASVDAAESLPLAAVGDYFGGRGGGIGQGVAGAIGAAVAFPDRPVLALTGDGSAMYSIQALWTAAHHNLSIVFVVLSNREYRVLKHNLDIYRARFSIESNKPYPHMDLTDPTLGFPELAAGMGIQGEVVTAEEEVAGAVRRAFEAGGPRLVEVVISGKDHA